MRNKWLAGVTALAVMALAALVLKLITNFFVLLALLWLISIANSGGLK